MTELPSWLRRSEAYEAPAGKNRFLTKNILSMLSLLRLEERSYLDSVHFSIPCKLLLTVFLILLLSLAQSKNFLFCVLLVVVVRLCLLPNCLLRSVIGRAVGAGLFTLAMLLPSYFLGQRTLLVLLPLKVFLSVSLIGSFAGTTPWHKLARCLRWLGLPDFLILTFSLAIKYIDILGKICLQVLQAMQLRTVGRLQSLDKAFSGILGVTFLHAMSMAGDTYAAMRCRGFTGSYEGIYHWHWHRGDFLMLALMLVFTYLFFVWETSLC